MYFKESDKKLFKTFKLCGEKEVQFMEYRHFFNEEDLMIVAAQSCEIFDFSFQKFFAILGKMDIFCTHCFLCEHARKAHGRFVS